MFLRHARPADADELTGLALRSKAHWGYDAEFIEACRAELTITADRIATEQMVVAEIDGRPVGFASLAGDSLEDLFVEPDHIGQGVGSALLTAIVGAARNAGIATIRIEADPYAADWYRSRGAVDIGTAPSGSVPGRNLPLLTLHVPENP